MWKIKSINYSNLFIILLVFTFFSCQKEKCTTLKPKSGLPILSGVLINDTLITTIQADTLLGETIVHHIIGFDKNGNEIFIEARSEFPFMLAKQGKKVYAYNPVLPSEMKIYEYNCTNKKESTRSSMGFLYLFSKKKEIVANYNKLGVQLDEENYFEFFEDEKNGKYITSRQLNYKEYNQTSFQGFAGDSHVYNDTLYVEDKCFCIEKYHR